MPAVDPSSTGQADIFNRLKATGVVNVRNPVEEAVREDRFEEVE